MFSKLAYLASNLCFAVSNFNREAPCRFQFEICHKVKTDSWKIVGPGHFTTDSGTSPFVQLSSGNGSIEFEVTQLPVPKQCSYHLSINNLCSKVYITVKKIRTFNSNILNFVSFWTRN